MKEFDPEALAELKLKYLNLKNNRLKPEKQTAITQAKPEECIVQFYKS